MHGLRSLTDLPRALGAPYAARKSGFLHFRRESERRSLRFRQGEIVYASTNVAEDHLGETLVRHGWLLPEDLQAASEVVRREGRRLGSVLVAMGFIDGGRLEEALMLHARAVIDGLFAWQTGGYEFEEDGTSLPAEGDVRDRSTVELIADTARRLGDAAALRSALGDLDRTLSVGDVAPGSRPVTLSSIDAFVLGQVDGNRTARDIIALRPEASREILRSMLTLLCIGLLEWSSALEATSAFEIRDALARAETFLEIESHGQAIQVLEKILPRVRQPETKQAARILLARAYAHNPKGVRRAEDVLLTVVREDSQNVEAFFMLGKLYRSQQLRHRAESMLRRVLELEPGHGPAAAELKALGGGPLFKKLFGKD
jgi:tetratricopeptide (TPR) repeat protein